MVASVAFNPPPRHEGQKVDLNKCLRGYIVRTPDGWGIVNKDPRFSERPSPVISIDLDWREGEEKRESITLRDNDILECSFCRLGDSVDTVFGSGVVINFRRTDRIYAVRLWRPWGAGSSTLYCNESMLRRVVPAAVGFNVKTPEGEGIVRGIPGPEGKDYTIELVKGDNPSGIYKAVCSKDVHCPEAVALPLVEHFSLALMGELCQYHGMIDTIRRRLEAAGLHKWEELISAGATAGMALLQDATTGIKADSGDVQMDDLLDQGLAQVRNFTGQLQHNIVASSESDEDAKRILKSSEEGLNALMQQIGADKGLTVESLAVLAEKDPKLLEIVQNIQERQKELDALGAQVQQTKTSQVFVQNKDRLEERLKDVLTSESPEFEKIEKRTQKFLDKLLKEDKIKAKAEQVGKQLANSFQGNLASENVNLEQWMENIGQKLIDEHLQHHKDLVKGLESVGEFKFDFKKLDFEKLAREQWDPAVLQTNVQKLLAEGFEQSKLDMTGTELLDQFHGKQPLGAHQLVQQTSGGLIDVLEDLGIEIPGPIRKALEEHADGSAGDRVWESALVSTLEDDEVAKGASELVANTENVLIEINKLKKNEVVLSILKSLEDIDFEDEILENIAKFDADIFLEDCEAIMTSHQARTKLVDGLFDAALSFVLKVLPAIKIPEVSGEHMDHFFRVRNLDMSGIRFKKESAKLVLEDPARLAPGKWREVELLKFECKDISAVFQRLECYVRQLHYPNGETSAFADASATAMTLQLGFKAQLTGDERLVLDLSRLEIHMDNLSIEIDENPMAWLINPAVVMLNPLLRLLICNSLKGILEEPMVGLCTQLNALLANAKPMLAKIGWPPKGLTGSPSIKDKFWQSINVVGGTPDNRTFLTITEHGPKLLSVDPKNRHQRFWITQVNYEYFHIQTLDHSTREPVFLSASPVGGVETWITDDESERQRWEVVKGDGDVEWYHIKVKGGTWPNKIFLSANTFGDVDLWGEDDESGRQRWILTSGAVEDDKSDSDNEVDAKVMKPMSEATSRGKAARAKEHGFLRGKVGGADSDSDNDTVEWTMSQQQRKEPDQSVAEPTGEQQSPTYLSSLRGSLGNVTAATAATTTAAAAAAATATTTAAAATAATAAAAATATTTAAAATAATLSEYSNSAYDSTATATATVANSVSESWANVRGSLGNLSGTLSESYSGMPALGALSGSWGNLTFSESLQNPTPEGAAKEGTAEQQAPPEQKPKEGEQESTRGSLGTWGTF